ncbi:MAG: T9SS type A sorting domain-containing protein [Hymenobacter sp.]|nr:MAG: T9SS type A sorting domain-containing protein [Hymenobacter sp.]
MGLGLEVLLAKPAASATYTLRNMLGQSVASSIFMGSATRVSTTGLSAGTYLLSVQPAGEAAVTTRVTLE